MMLVMMFRAGVNVHDRFYINPRRSKDLPSGDMRVRLLKAAMVSIGGLAFLFWEFFSSTQDREGSSR